MRCGIGSVPRIALLALSVTAGAAKELPPGTPLLPQAALAAFKLRGSEEAVHVDTVPVRGQPFLQALRVRTLVRLPNAYSAQLSFRTTTPVRKDDVLLATFYLRSAGAHGETGEGRTTFVFEQVTAPNTKSVSFPAGAGPGWKRFDVPFLAVDRYAPGEARINFQLGFAPQQIEIGGISVVNYGARVELSELPRTRLTYAGREPDAPWRAAARERIEKIRKGDLTVLVTDRQGRPVAGADVHVRMRRHAFGFGSAVTAQMLLDNSADGRKYRQAVLTRFNKVVFENDLKWPQWENRADQDRTLQALRLLRAHGIAVRGHNLIWPSWRNMPRSLATLKDNPEALRRRIDEHIRDEAGRFAGQLAEWDVINEPFANHDVMDILGRDSMISWFKAVRQADPTARLFLNDYPPLDGSAAANVHRDSFENTLRFLIEGGAPLDGIGFQCHFGGNAIPPADLILGLNRFAKLGKTIEATEFDMDTTDEQLQADYMRDFLTALFSHPAVNGVMMWGFWEGRHWRPNAALWHRDWSVKPNGQAWLDLVAGTWWTDAHASTDPGGRSKTRGFLGDYEVSVTQGGKTATVTVALSAEGETVRVTLDGSRSLTEPGRPKPRRVPVSS